MILTMDSGCINNFEVRQGSDYDSPYTFMQCTGICDCSFLFKKHEDKKLKMNKFFGPGVVKVIKSDVFDSSFCWDIRNENHYYRFCIIQNDKLIRYVLCSTADVAPIICNINEVNNESDLSLSYNVNYIKEKQYKIIENFELLG